MAEGKNKDTCMCRSVLVEFSRFDKCLKKNVIEIILEVVDCTYMERFFIYKPYVSVEFR